MSGITEGLRGDDEKGGPAANVIEDLLSAIKADEPVDEKYCIVLGQHTLWFRSVRSLEERERFIAGGKTALKRWKDWQAETKVTKVPPGYKEALKGRSESDLIGAWTLVHYSAEPTKFTEIQALRLTKKPDVAERIIDAINRAYDSGVYQLFNNAVDKEKKSLNRTRTTTSGSRSRGKSTANTRTT